MKKISIVFVILSIFTGQAIACNVIDHIPAADTNILGLSWGFDGTIWASHGYVASQHKNKIVQTNTNGHVLKVIRPPGDLTSNSGIAFDGQDLWYADYYEGKIYRMNTNGKVEHTIKAPENISAIVRARWNLWAVSSNQKIYQIAPTDGTILKTFNAPGWENNDWVFSYGLAWDGVYLWVSQNDGIYKLDPGSGEILYSCEGDQFQLVSAITWDGQNILAGQAIMSIAIKVIDVGP